MTYRSILTGIFILIALTDHKKAVHENVKSYSCEWPGCHKKFLQSCHLRKHMMAHADIKPFQCDWPNCNYRAVSLSYVTNHKKVSHSLKNTKPEYFCSVFLLIFFSFRPTPERKTLSAIFPIVINVS